MQSLIQRVPVALVSVGRADGGRELLNHHVYPACQHFPVL
jgi:hypothetical protein